MPAAADNVFAGEPPGTFDPVTLEFTPHDPSLLRRLGFERIPVEKIGLQRDPWRSDIPLRSATQSR
jgi:hypothetical protein